MNIRNFFKSPIIKFFAYFFFAVIIYAGCITILNCFLRNKGIVFDDADKQNLIQIALLIGAVMALLEARRLREIEYQPILSLYIRDALKDKEGNQHKRYRWCFYRNFGETICKYFAIRNTGKGTALNLRVQVKNSKGKELEIKNISGAIIAPKKDEVAIDLKQLDPKNEKEMNGVKFLISSETITGNRWSSTYEVTDAIKGVVAYRGMKKET